jgi:tetratricopeptide (TPR) repeat protein
MIKRKLFFDKWKDVMEHPLFIVPTAAFDVITGVILTAAKSLSFGAFSALSLLLAAFSVSALVAARRLPKEEEMSRAVESALARGYAEISENKLSVAYKCFNEAMLYAETEQRLRIFMGLGDLRKKCHQWDAAVENYEKSIADCSYPWQADACLRLGRIHKDLLRVGDALAAFLKAAEIRARFDMPSDESAVALYRLIAECYEKRGESGDADLARQWLQKEMSVRDGLLPDENNAKAIALCSRAKSHEIAEKYEEAEKTYVMALKFLEPNLSALHPRIALIYNNLGRIACDQNCYADALKWFADALTARYTARESKKYKRLPPDLILTTIGRFTNFWMRRQTVLRIAR